MRDHILLDYVEWINDLVRARGKCSKCDFEATNHLTPSVNLPYVNQITDKRKLVEVQIENIMGLVENWVS